MVGASVFREIEKTFIERPTTFRVNTVKAKKPVVLEVLREAGFKMNPVSWYPDAFILQNKSKRNLTDLPLYIDGQIYIQSLASMVPPLVLDPQPGEQVLDLTAAPGSKTSQIAALMKRQGELMANDSNKIRFFKLMHNMEILGVVETPEEAEEGTGGGAQKPWSFTLKLEHGSKLAGDMPNYFDKILLDAPCGAEARFIAGDIKTYGYWNEKKIKEMAYKQRQLLFSAWHALKPGGTLVYSTCTFAPEENELQVSRLIERYPDVEILPIDLPQLKTLLPVKEWKGKGFHADVQKTVRIFPTSQIEGFFIAKLRKKESEDLAQS